MSADTIVGERVHNLMWRGRVSQTRLATLLGLAQPNVGKRLRGETSWTLDELLVVARFFEVPLAELLPGEEYDPVPQGRGRKVVGGGMLFLPAAGQGWCAIRDSNPEPADSAPRRHLHAVAAVPCDSPTLPVVQSRRHLGVVRLTAVSA